MTCEQLGDTLYLYAVGALDGAQAETVEQHVAVCRPCRIALDDAHRLVGFLPLAIMPRQPSPKLKAAVLHAARSAQPAAQDRWSLRQALLRWGPALATAALVFAAVALVWALGVQARLEQNASQLAALDEKLRERDALVAVMSGSAVTELVLTGTIDAPSAGARLYLDPAAMQGALIAWDLPSLPAENAYQLWLIDDTGQRTSGGVFRPSGQGLAQIVVRCSRPFSSYRGLGVTIEPAKGSPGPTGKRVLAGTF
jgi:anti-sigma-K factor RskA